MDPLVRGFVAVDEQCLVEQEAPRLGRLHYKRPVGGWLLNHRPEELPNSYRVILRYEGERGPLPPDVQRLDLDLYCPLVPVRLDTVHHIAQQLGKIEQHISGYIARQRSEGLGRAHVLHDPPGRPPPPRPRASFR